MNGRYLLDTNISIALFADELEARTQLSQAEEVFLPIIAIGELYYGARKSGKVAQNLQRIEQFATNNIVLGCNVATAQYYGDIKNKLRLRGRPLPENDIWIAALAVQYNLTLVTRDEHFLAIESLQVVRW